MLHIDPATEPTTAIEPSILWWGLGGGIVALAVVLYIGAFMVPQKRDRKPDLPAGATWKWADSWATNLTGLIAALGTAAAFFSDQLKTLIDQSVLVTYGLATALLLAVAACAPVAYAAFQEVPDAVRDRKVTEEEAPEEDSGLIGTWWGWCVASSLTIFAVEGCLFAAQRGLSLTGGGALRAVVMIGIGLMQILVMVYAWRTFALVIKSAKGKVLASGLPGIVDQACCGTTAAGRRMTLM
jgi:hypothetical protein